MDKELVNFFKELFGEEKEADLIEKILQDKDKDEILDELMNNSGDNND